MVQNVRLWNEDGTQGVRALPGPSATSKSSTAVDFSELRPATSTNR
jgi:hypothetical protein